jgi:hypothetical protein
MTMVNLKMHSQLATRSRKSGFVALHAPALDGQQYAQMFSESNALQNRVVPTPYANNGYRNNHGELTVTCKNACNPIPAPPIDQRIGYTTSDILNKRRLIKMPPADQPFPPNDPVVTELLNAIANPLVSHVCNTDCVSCHTETVIWQDQLQGPISGIDPCSLPGDNRYNMRAFGWSPQEFDNESNRDFVRATVSRRAANETMSVLTFVNQVLLQKSWVAPVAGEISGINARDCKQD